jgi:hypothetical protein
MKERGRYQIQLMKTRSSNGVGMKVDLEYNIETMRITDPGEDGQEHFGGPPKIATNIMSQIKTSSTVNPTAPSGPIDQETGEIANPGASVNSAKLKQMLAGLKSS